jgi:lipopolysaccharide biosynthesis protein
MARAVSFYLPQYHPTPENDEWWGPGFTEWTNAARARPLFPGHHQPHLPADLGFYDLRLPEAREAQAALAREYGVEAFCYWHYWFGAGRRILERPFSEVLATGSPDMSFCLGWANQTWTGVWHGAADRVLLEQRYPGPEDDRQHFATVLPAFCDDRYLRVDERPVFYVFRPEELPDAAAFVDRWQAMAREAGLGGLYLVAEVSDLLGHGPRYTRVAADGFDAGVYVRLPVVADRAATLRMRLLRKAIGGPEIYPYADELPRPPDGPDRHLLQPCVYPNWDNTPRSGRRGLAITRTAPDSFESHVRQAMRAVADRPSDQRLVWVKSWNEWAEGNYLEPDLEFGRGWLRALKRGMTGG